MKYLLASLLIAAAFTSSLEAAPSANEYAETHQTFRIGGSKPMPIYLMLTREQKEKFADKRPRDEEGVHGDYILQTYQNLFRHSAAVFRGRILLEQADKDRASVSVQRIYKGSEESIPKLVEIDDHDCLDQRIISNNFIFFLAGSELAPAIPNFCELEIQEVYHPAMQYLDQWEK